MGLVKINQSTDEVGFGFTWITCYKEDFSNRYRDF